MKAFVLSLLVVCFAPSLSGQESNSTPQQSIPAYTCTIGSPPEFDKPPSPQLQTKIDALRHRTIYACAGRNAEWAERIVIPAAKTPASCREARARYPRPVWPALQPMEIEDAGYSSVDGRTDDIQLVFRLPSGRQVKLVFPEPDDRVSQSDDLMVTLGLLRDPYNSPFTPAEVKSIQNKDFPVGTRIEVFGCAYRFASANHRRDQQKREWWVFDGKAYRFKEGRVAEILEARDLK